jgi:hypothetical protein
MLVELTYLDERPAAKADARDFRFEARSWRDAQQVRSVIVRLDRVTQVNVKSRLGGLSSDDVEGRLRNAVYVVALRRLASLGRALIESTDASLTLHAEYDDLIAVVDAPKGCSHQERRPSGLYCIAAKQPAPTTLHACDSTCDLPDTRLLCSGFVHLEMAMAATFPPAPIAAGRICEKGQQKRIEEAKIRCTPGGHDCWHRLVELAPEPHEASLHPLALNEALDFLGWVWRAKFAKSQTKLIRLASSAAAAEVSQPCSTADAFRSRMNALADLLDSLKIDGALMPAPGQTKGTLNRLLAALREALPQDEFERAEVAIKALRSVVAIRTGLHHSDAGHDAPAAARTLGLDWPPADWGSAWEQIRDCAARAVRDVRQAIQATMLDSDRPDAAAERG